eukprot:615400-Karenia_brevis.AAC.1
MADTGTLALVRTGVMGHLQQQRLTGICLECLGPCVLRNVCVCAVVLNQRDRCEWLSSILQTGSESIIRKESFQERFESKFGRAAPRAILQSARGVLKKYGCKNHFDNSCAYVEDMSRKCKSAWRWLDSSTTCNGQDISGDTLGTLRRELGLGPFSAMLVARNLSIVWPKFYCMHRCDLGKYAKMASSSCLGWMQFAPANMQCNQARIGRH